MSTEAGSGGERGVRRQLRFWEAIAVSIGILAASAAMALEWTLRASLVGRVVPPAFASEGNLFVFYAFIRLTSHSGGARAYAAPSHSDVRTSSA